MNTSIFLTALAVYIICLIALSLFVSRNNKSGEDFLLAGRGLPIFLTIGTTVATMVGTGSSMGAVGFGYANGWAGMLYGVGGAVGILLLGLWFAPVRKFEFMTMSEEISYYVGANRWVKNIVAVLIFVASIGWLGAHILGGGLYLAWIADVELQTAKIIIAVSFAIYVIIGGYNAVVWTDTLQAIILFFGFILMAVLAVDAVGGWQALMDAQPVENISFLAIDAVGSLHAVSLMLVVAVGVLATPSFRQRIYSAQTVSSVRKSFYISGTLYVFFSCVPAIIGMGAYALNPELENRNFAFPFLAAEVLPLAVGVVVLIAGLSATMSSASSDAIAGVSILMRDTYAMVTGKMPPKNRVIHQSRLALLGIIAVALGFALLSNDIIGYITTMISTVMAGLFVCGLLGRFWLRYNAPGAIASLLAASVASLVVVNFYQGFWGNPVIPAVISSLVVGIVVTLLTPTSKLTSEQALKVLGDERHAMEGGRE
ncbi:sodium:solute symporter family protein [Gilvimarinus sp. SDUM040013]|uniref:Sodium:solute symporter family protein n=1 Tax=Gilvimarinus gilvus TaxID=3058038 RepID=A0ABU4RZV4_9GAMM|nr:sodium:solute symporter family protein [Gilvimarinus sp. SDUM040013]MDO3388599.1 sodium:solute symporter family protein [Gilvimarinus sp. SDUM040013]MDX6848529.1 sodium:solute symporter family protein [Gilvimarinus sp. SDUM040013]